MKPNKNTIKAIKEFSILIDKLIELKKVSVPVPEYKKSSTFSEMWDKVKKEDPVLKNAYEEINKTITEKCSCKRLVNLEQCKSALIEECDYCKNKISHFWPITESEKPVIDWNENYDYWLKNIKDKESKEPYSIFQLRNVFGNYTHKEIISNPELVMKAKISLIETLKLF